ncbi:MAG: hypothetical protein KAZ22_00190 [Parabacteroides sp.]|nr:hypothetical protein [Parabacteroides sp.]
MNLVVYLDPNYVDEKIGESVTNISEAGKVAVEAALQLKEKNNGTAAALIVGEAPNEDILREAYAMGADASVLANKEYTAANVAAVVKAKGYDVVVTAEDTAAAVAAELGWSVVDFGGASANTVVAVKGDEVKPRYMHITRVFNAYEYAIEEV